MFAAGITIAGLLTALLGAATYARGVRIPRYLVPSTKSHGRGTMAGF